MPFQYVFLKTLISGNIRDGDTIINTHGLVVQARGVPGLSQPTKSVKEASGTFVAISTLTLETMAMS